MDQIIRTVDELFGEKRTPELLDQRVQPTGDNLYVVMEPKHEMAGEIHLSNNQSQRTRVAVILAVGPEVDQGKFKIGGKILMTYYAGTPLHLPGYKVVKDDRYIMSQENVMAFLDE